MKKVEHIGIAVKDLTKSCAVFSDIFGSDPYKIERVESENVKTAFFRIGPNKFELLESTNKNGVISKFIQNRGEGIHHIAFEVSDIYAEMKRLENIGYQLLNNEPKLGADNKLVCFLHPKSCNGVLIELCQEKNT